MTEISKNCLNIFEDLEKELHRAVRLDEVYTLRNEAKFRAVHQNVESYEEFKEIVNAAHLQPLKKDDLQELRKPKPAAWNCMVSSQATAESKIDLTNEKDSQIGLTIPPTYEEFLKCWQKSRLADERRLNLLKSVKAEWLTRILTMETSSGSTGNIMKALRRFEDNNEDVGFVVRVLVAMSAMPRFELSMEFLTKEEKEVGKQMFELLDQRTLLPELESSRIAFLELGKKYAKVCSDP